MEIALFQQILISSIAATSVMTLFSYMVSAGARELYKEPVLLTYILTMFGLELPLLLKSILGWLLHYLIGLAFVIAYHYLWINDVVAMHWPAILLLGGVSGFVGIFSWIIMFALTPKKPAIDFKGYYAQLFIAHIIFTIIAFLVYNQFH